jgi:hypothetical protein
LANAFKGFMFLSVTLLFPDKRHAADSAAFPAI